MGAQAIESYKLSSYECMDLHNLLPLQAGHLKTSILKFHPPRKALDDLEVGQNKPAGAISAITWIRDRAAYPILCRDGLSSNSQLSIKTDFTAFRTS
jgi:hypothetical protein